MSRWRWLRIPGFFFHRWASPTTTTDSFDGWQVRKEFVSTAGHRVAIKAEELGNVVVTAVTGLE